MITEDYVSFETAKLLKEKGFDAELKMYWSMGTFDIPILHCCPQHLVDDGEEPMPIEIDNSGIECTSRSNPWKPEEFECIAPTLQMVMKWLRKMHNIHIYTIDTFIGFKYVIQDMLHHDEDIHPIDGICFSSNEEAAEAAIKYCLENLI